MFPTCKTIAIEPVQPRLLVARPALSVSGCAIVQVARRANVVSASHRVRDSLVLRVVAKKNIVCLMAGEAGDGRRHG